MNTRPLRSCLRQPSPEPAPSSPCPLSPDHKARRADLERVTGKAERWIKGGDTHLYATFPDAMAELIDAVRAYLRASR